MLVVKGREALAVVNGLADDKHRSEGEVVVVNDLGKVLEYASIYFLVGPRQMVAGGDGGVGRIFL